MNKTVKIALVALVIVALAVGGFGVYWLAQPTIDCRLDAAYTTWAQDNPVNMTCWNTGLTAGTFDLLLSMDGAHFSLKTSLPYTQVDERNVRFTFTLQHGETQTRTAWIIIDGGVTAFNLRLEVVQNGGNAVRSGDVSVLDYFQDSSGNFTLNTFPPVL